jgi:2-oxoglutarate ferredoxin oxidoreductase subunit alpha
MTTITSATRTMGWHTIPSVLPPGRYLMQGDEACAEGAIAAGCTYYAGYPITPASEIMELIARRFCSLPGRVFAQMEDEIASIGSVVGASWAGAKAMTATSGPGFSLMMENLAYAIMTETPLVIVDVQRAGPSTGQATRPSQGDVMQARYGAGSDYEIIVLTPWSAAEMYSETIRAFNLAERFRLPVIVLADEAIGHLREKVEIGAETSVFGRIRATGAAPFVAETCDAIDAVPPMPAFGDGERLLVTGSTHDARGYRRTSEADAQAMLVEHLTRKVLDHRDAYARVERLLMGDDEELDVLFISFGFSARSAYRAAQTLRTEGCRAGLLRLCTLWPFDDQAVRAATAKARRILVPEMNRGQALREVQRLAPGARGCNRTDGEVITPDDIVAAVRDWQ